MPPRTERKGARDLPQWADMQGLVLSGYPHLDQAAYLLFTIDRPELAKDWLAGVLDMVTRAFKNTQKRSPRTNYPLNLNVAFTASGLRKLCGRVSHFSDPFTEGMAGPGPGSHRSLVLGDTGVNRPEAWRWGSARNPVDLLVMIYADRCAPLEEEIAAVSPPPGAAVPAECIIAERLRDMDGREHFGFKDGISQPILKGSFDAERFPDSVHLTALGEFVLGYPDESGIAIGRFDDTYRRVPLPAVARCEDFGRNGSYLVLRELAQHVDEFWSTMAERTRVEGRLDLEAAERLASKIVGRQRDGTPLVAYATAEDNEFGYAEDPYGYGCPIGAHIRRSNPRDGFENNNLPLDVRNDHRLLRRGRSYRRPADRSGSAPPERGLVFLCLNADIEGQFEFIQQNWINNTTFHGLSDEEDPLIGYTPGRAARGGTLTIGSVPAPLCVRELPRFVSVMGGQYFFLPGLKALNWLAHHA